MTTDALRADVAIIGAGPVGLFAIFECGMLGLTCHVFDALSAAGGQCMALYPEKPIFDIPGYPSILGAELVDRLVQQAAPFKPVYHLGAPVTDVVPMDGGAWRVGTGKGAPVEVTAVIVAGGVGAFGPNRPPLDGIERFEGGAAGRGVHYLVARREDFRGRRVVIAGGGDSAVDWAVSLAEVAEQVFVVHRRDKFRAAPGSVGKLRALAAQKRIDLIVPYQLHALEERDGAMSAVIVADFDGGTRRLAADALLPFFGLSQNLGPIAQWGLRLHRNHIAVDPATCAAGQQGIFAIGDVVTYPGKLKLILTGFAEAAMAAHAIHPLVHPGEVLHFEYSTTKGVPQ
ncbi:MAG: NAD(P)/FAD-dependent oxidoreductase [Rhodospirillales bacterium]|nr:NAD(P)/FAD-dependent oxidoreductase [Rhodospirillales bacterium]